MAELGIASYGLSFVAGTLSILSPCVLPLIPILLGSVMATSRWAPLALGSGVAISFAATGTALASLGHVFLLSPEALRMAAAVMLITFGAILLSTWLQQRFILATAGIGNAGNNWAAKFSPAGNRGQFVLGLLLGIAWSPCVGPTLGVAITLASQGNHLDQVALVMFLFGLGASLPIIGLGMLSQHGMQRARVRMAAIGQTGKQWLGVIMLFIGVLIVSGWDKEVEAGILSVSPDWLVQFTTSI